MNNSLQEKWHQQEGEHGSSSKKLKVENKSFCRNWCIEDSCCNGLADDVFPSPVSSGPHCTKTNLQRSENRSRKVRFREFSGLFLLFTVERIIFPDHLLDMRHFHSQFMDLWAIQNLTEISFIPCLFSYC